MRCLLRSCPRQSSYPRTPPQGQGKSPPRLTRFLLLPCLPLPSQPSPSRWVTLIRREQWIRPELLVLELALVTSQDRRWQCSLQNPCLRWKSRRMASRAGRKGYGHWKCLEINDHERRWGIINGTYCIIITNTCTIIHYYYLILWAYAYCHIAGWYPILIIIIITCIAHALHEECVIY